MRGLVLFVAFFSALPLIFTRGPFFGILMWFWISLMVPQKAVWGSIFAAIPYALIIAVATLLAMLFYRDEPKLPPASKTTVLLLLLMLWVSVTSYYGIGPTDQVIEKWQDVEKMLLMTIVAFTLTNSRVRLEQLTLVCVLSIGFWGFRGGLIAITTAGGGHVQGPDNSMIGDNNNLGVALTMILPLIFYLRDRYQQPWIKWSLLGLFGLTVLGDIFTYSRGALVAITAMGVMLWLRSRKKVQVLVLIAVAAVGVWNLAPERWTNRMFSIETYQQDSSAEGRLDMWQRSWIFAKMSPLVGGGFNWSYDPNTVNRLFLNTDLPPMTGPLAPHSIWFEMLGEHGFVGLGLFVAIVATAFLDAQWLIRHAKDPDLLWANNLGRMLQVALVGFCAGGTFLTMAMYDGFYAVVIIAAVARRVVGVELVKRKAAVPLDGNLLAAAQSGAGLSPQPSG